MPFPDPISDLPAKAGDDRGRDSLTAMVVSAAIIAALYFGREILMPIALAGLLGFALEPLTTRLRRWGVGRKVAVTFVVIMALIVVATIAVFVVQRVYQLAENLPTYQENIQRKIRALNVGSDRGVIEKASKTLQKLEEEIQKPDAASRADPAARAPRAPTVVRVEPAPTTAFQTLQSVAGPLVKPASIVGLVIVFLLFMMLQQEDIRDRFIRLVSARHFDVTTQAIGEAAERVSNYLLMQLCINAMYGFALGIGLYLIGLPNALLWGLLGTALRFIPYAGAFITAVFPVTLAIAVDPGWTMVLSTLALFLLIEVITINILEPWLYGSSTGLSPVAIILAAIFWTTIWGPAGLLISTPLTVCVVVLGRYVPQLNFIHVLLGNAPALSPHERFYQRMLAGDTDEGVELAQPYFASGDLAGFHDDIALAALKLAESDRQRGAIGQERTQAIERNIVSVLGDLSEDGLDVAARAEVVAAPVQWTGTPVVCIGGRSPLDTASAALLSDHLNRIGIGSRYAHIDLLSTPEIRAAIQAAEVVAVIYLSQKGPNHARQITRRLRRMTSGRILIGYFNGQREPDDPDGGPAPPLPMDFIADSPADALSWINTIARTPLADAMAPAPIPDNEAGRLAELQRLQLLDTPPESAFDELTRQLAASLGVPIALVSLVDESRQFWKASSGLSDDLALRREAPRETSVCGHVVAHREMIVIEDVLRDTRFANNPFLREHGIRFYAGAPLLTPSGAAIGSVCVMDSKPRTMDKAELAILQITAEQVMAKIVERAERLETVAE